jgi:hypothetical protein
MIAAALLATALATTPGAPTREQAWIARVVVPTSARATPGGARVVGRVTPRARWNGGPVGLLVLGVRTDAAGRRWLRVALPRRPNRTRGWIPADDARVTATPYRIEIGTATRRLRLLRGGRVILRARAVVGKPGTPTPHGLFAIAERVRQPDPGAFLGPWSLPLTAFSDVLERYGGGPGQVAIHGRAGASLADPLGTARSHGCIRIDNAAVRRLAAVAREGTPVRIVARLSHLTR